MSYQLRQRFVDDLVESLQSSSNSVDKDELRDIAEELVENHVDIHDPELDNFYQMSGRVLDAERREPIEVTLDNPTKAELISILGPAALSGISFTSGSPDLVTLGAALLSVYAVVAQGHSVNIEPDVALTYAVGWDLSNCGEEKVPLDKLENTVIAESINHDKKKKMNESDVEMAVWQLKKMKSIQGDSLLTFREECTIKYR